MNPQSNTLDALAEAEKAGFDLGLMRESLALTPQERTRQHAAALALVLQLEKAGNTLHGRSQPTPETGHGRRN